MNAPRKWQVRIGGAEAPIVKVYEADRVVISEGFVRLFSRSRLVVILSQGTLMSMVDVGVA